MFYTFMKSFLPFMDKWGIEIFCVSLVVFLISAATLRILGMKGDN